MDHVEMPQPLYTGDTICACGRAEETTAHMLQYSHLVHQCSLDDLITFNDVGKQCVELSKTLFDGPMMMTKSNSHDVLVQRQPSVLV